ncbi:MAG TPA: sugar phosphate isomerase/epimerase family protein [Planctomycetia bacterium]|nr:sugar phosphate isomerase/epimerase family protein [Planctomycetia bacterium]
MPALSFAIRLECLGVKLRDALPLAAKLGFRGVQFDAAGELAPDELSATGRRHLLHLLSGHRLDLVAVGFVSRRGFDALDRLEGRLAAAEKTLKLAGDLRAPIVAASAGPIPPDPAAPATKHFFDAMERLGAEAIRLGVRLALETGNESPESLAAFLAANERLSLAVHFDPANLLVRGFNPADAARTLAGRIAGVHVKDVVRTGAAISGFKETPIGEGEIDFNGLFVALAEADFRGPWTVESELVRPPEEFARAFHFLSQL